MSETAAEHLEERRPFYLRLRQRRAGQRAGGIPNPTQILIALRCPDERREEEDDHCAAPARDIGQVRFIVARRPQLSLSLSLSLEAQSCHIASPVSSARVILIFER